MRDKRNTPNSETLMTGMIAFAYDACFQIGTLVSFLSNSHMHYSKFNVDLSGIALK